MRKRLAYKKAELEAVKSLVAINKERPKSIGYLKRIKERLEFKIATEATSLGAEKELVRKIDEVERELEKSLKVYKMHKKVELVTNDIEEASKQIDEVQKKIADSDKVLDDLYGELRRITGYRNGEHRGSRTSSERKEGGQKQPAEISFADIAVIKDKTGNSGYSDDADISSN